MLSFERQYATVGISNIYASFPVNIALEGRPAFTQQFTHCIITETPENARIIPAVTTLFLLLKFIRLIPREISIPPVIIALMWELNLFNNPDVDKTSANIPKKVIYPQIYRQLSEDSVTA